MATTIDIESIRSRHLRPYEHTYTHKDLILYALALGFTAEDLQYVYEQHPDFKPLPLYAIIAAHPTLAYLPLEHYIPGFDRMRGLHGEQYLEVFSQLPSHGQLITQPHLVDVRDKGKGKGCVAVVRTLSRDAVMGHVVAENEFVIYGLGAGGFGSPWPPAPRPAAACALNRPPNRPPDKEVLVSTSPDQAALYRLCGDLNPLHIDPVVANKVGFKKPILHGLCTMGISVKAVVQAMAGGEFGRLRTAKVRFSKPCLPGDMLRVRMWRVDTSDTPTTSTTSTTPTTSSSDSPQTSTTSARPTSGQATHPGGGAQRQGQQQLDKVVFEVLVVKQQQQQQHQPAGGKEVVVITGAAVELAATLLPPAQAASRL